MKFKVDKERLKQFIVDNGLPPKKASSVHSGYWMKAAEAACNVKVVSSRLAKAVSCHWYGNICNFKTLTINELCIPEQKEIESIIEVSIRNKSFSSCCIVTAREW